MKWLKRNASKQDSRQSWLITYCCNGYHNFQGGLNRMGRFSAHLSWLALSVICVLWMTACGKPEQAPQQNTVTSSTNPQERMLSSDEIQKKYRNCSDGYYSGPQPGKARYTKDDYLWVVTPEFAKRYCMPPEFIDRQLKGALAIAYKPVQEGTEECGFGGQKEVCGRRNAHGFEIYFDSTTQIESLHDTQYNYRAFYMLPHSKHLLSQNVAKMETPQQREAWEKERPGAQSRFRVSGWGIEGVKGDKVVWPITACGEIQYIDTILPDINYLSIGCDMGDFNNPRMQKVGATRFILGLMRLNDHDNDEGRPVKNFAHIIVLPDRLVQEVEAVDTKGTAAFQRLMQQALPEIKTP